MAKKLIFQKSGGNNISIDEEGLTANLWTEATFSDFGRYTPVFFGNLLYINLTGTFTTANPATDTTNWREIGTGSSSGNIQTITVNDGTGIVTITYNDGTTAETFNAGHQISVDGVAQPFQPTVDFHGNISEENDTTDNSTNLYFPLVANSTGTGETILDTTGSGGSDGKQPLETIKRIAGTADEIDVAAGTTSTPITVSLNSKIKNELASLIGPSGKLRNIGNVDTTFATLLDKQILEYDKPSDTWKPTNLPSSTPTTIEALTDVEVTSLSDQQILEYELSTNTWKNRNLPSQTPTTIEALTDVTVTNVGNQDILEYDTASTMWVNRSLPNGLVERLEDLEDVEIIGDEDNKILIARAKAAYFQVNPASIGDTIYDIDTSGGLMFTKPGGSTPLITSVAVAFALNRSGDTTSYLIVDETGGDQLLVEMSFTASSITIEQFIDRIVLALQTNWSDGTGTSTERTVSDQMAGSTLVGMNGTWSKAENPNFVRGEKASGTTSEFSIPPGAPPVNDAVAIRWNISGRPTGYIQGVTDTFTGLGNTPTVIELLDTGVAALNDPNNPGGFNQNFPPNYLATRVGNSIRVTSTIDGSQSNGILTLEFVDSATGASNASDYIGNEGTTTITGGVTGSGQEFSFRWTDSAHKHIIARPTLEAGGSATTTFSQGGFAWIDELPTLDLLSDVNINLPDPGNQQLQMLRSDFFGNFDNVDARVENLNVNSGIVPSTPTNKDAKVQGALLQYAPAGVGEWIWSGLKADGDGDFVLPPTQGEFLRFNQTGGVGEAWEASTAALNDLTDVDTVTKAPSEGDILKYVSGEWVPAEEIISATAYLGMQSATRIPTPADTTGFLVLFPIGRAPSFEAPTAGTFLKVLRGGTYAILGRISLTLETGERVDTVNLSLEVRRDGNFFTQLDSVNALFPPLMDGDSTVSAEIHTVEELALEAGDEIRIRYTVLSGTAFNWEYMAAQSTIDFITVTRLD